MADEISQGLSDRKAVEKRIKKLNPETRVATPPPDELFLINTQNVKVDCSFGSICVDINLISESSDTGIIYLNPQDPNRSLVEEISGFSSQDGQDHTGQEFVQCPKYVKEKSKICGPDEVLLNVTQQKERNHSKYLKSYKLQCDASVEQKASKLTVLFDEDNSIKKKNNNGHTAKNLLKKHEEEEKIPRFLMAMKKRSFVDSEQRPFKCTHCPWAFKKFCNLQSHLQTHPGLKPYVCDTCGKAYSHQGTLQQHKRLHTGERPYHCPFCVKTYIWSSDYRKHIRTHTGEKPYVCDTCSKDFIRSSDLRKHERNMHANNKPFPCTHCGKTFNKSLSLKRHERKHLGERPFSCPDCGKAFALASRMVEHQKIHKGVRPYVCSVCTKSFTKSSNLTEHEAIHSGVRPHKCKECGVAFAMASRLVRHQFIHSKEKRPSCKGWSKRFSHPATLKLNQDQTCAGTIFVCVKCNKSFQCATKLAQHMLSHRDKNA